MPKKRKKHPKLPNGFGSIRYLGKNRHNCYAVHPPAKIDQLGNVVRSPAICYVDDWIKQLQRHLNKFRCWVES